MDYKDYLKELLKDKSLTQNELTVMIEAAYLPFDRDGLLKGGSRVSEGTYSPAALTRTIQKLIAKNYLTEKKDSVSGKRVYECTNGIIDFGKYRDIVLNAVRSKIMTLNTMKVVLLLIIEDNVFSSARYIAKGLNMAPDYIVNTVLPRMCLVNLLERHIVLATDNLLFEDKAIVGQNPPLMTFSLNVGWKSEVAEKWM